MAKMIAITIKRLGLNWIELKVTLRQVAWVDSFDGQFRRLEEAMNSRNGIARAG
jgi:hypothetical protein